MFILGIIIFYLFVILLAKLYHRQVNKHVQPRQSANKTMIDWDKPEEISARQQRRYDNIQVYTDMQAYLKKTNNQI